MHRNTLTVLTTAGKDLGQAGIWLQGITFSKHRIRRTVSYVRDAYCKG
jgi:hypothetical protein